MRVRVASLDRSYDPDASVVCGELQRGRRAEAGWTVHEHGPGARVTLASIGATLDVDALHRSRLAG